MLENDGGKQELEALYKEVERLELAKTPWNRLVLGAAKRRIRLLEAALKAETGSSEAVEDSAATSVVDIESEPAMDAATEATIPAVEPVELLGDDAETTGLTLEGSVSDDEVVVDWQKATPATTELLPENSDRLAALEERPLATTEDESADEGNEVESDSVVETEMGERYTLPDIERYLDELEQRAGSETNAPDARQVLLDQRSQLTSMGNHLRLEPGDEQIVQHTQALGRFQRIIQPVLQSLLAECRQSLTQLAGMRLTKESLEPIGEKVGDIREPMEFIHGLSWVFAPQQRQTAEEVYNQFQDWMRVLEPWQKYQKLAQDVERQLKEAEQREKQPGGGAAAFESVSNAFSKVNAQLHELPSDGSEQAMQLKLELQSLLGRINMLRGDYGKRHDIATTATAIEPTANLIREWVGLPTSTKVTFYNNRFSDNVAEQTMGQALPIARDRYLAQVIERIDKTYLPAALGYLEGKDSGGKIRRPDLARTELARWLQLSGINESDVMPLDMKRSIEQRLAPQVRDIEVEYNKWQDAEKHIGVARGLALSEPLAAYSEYKAALEAYPYHEALPGLLESISWTAASAFERHLQEAEEAVSQEQWVSAREKVDGAKELATLKTPSPEQRQKVGELQRLLTEYITKLDQRGTEALKSDEEYRLLQKVRGEFSDYWQGWNKLPARLHELELRQAVEGLVAEANRLSNAEATVSELERLQRDIAARLGSLTQSGDTRDEKERSSLKSAQTKVAAWLGFARARDELRKEENLQRLSIDQLQADVIEVPDLAIVSAGIEAARTDSNANRAANAAYFGNRLATLKSNDIEVKKVLEWVRSGRTMTAVPTLEELVKWRGALKAVRLKPSSHVRDVLVLYRDVQQVLREKAAAQLATVLADGDVAGYQTLNVNGRFDSAANSLLDKEIRELWQEVDGDASSLLRQRAIAALAFLKAQRSEAEVGKMTTWSDVREAWNTAQNRVPESDAQANSDNLDELRRYARSKYAQAWKQSTWGGAEQTEERLWALCQDELLRLDWEVWFRHGNFCLGQARAQLQADEPGPVADTEELLRKAQFSLAEAQRLVVDGPPKLTVEKTCREYEQWQRVTSVDRRIRQMLGLLPEQAADPVTSGACRQAVDLYQKSSANGHLELEAGSRQVLEKIWVRRRQAALQRLQVQYKKQLEKGAGTLFDQLDTLVAQALLYPDDERIKLQVQQRFEQALNELETIKRKLAFDVNGGAYRTYHQEQQPDHQPPDDEQIAQLQAEACAALQRHVQTLRMALPLTSLSETVYAPRLTGLEDDLGRWQELVSKHLVNPLADARRKADNGLRDPGLFEVARYILRLGGTGLGSVEQVKDEFVSNSHLSWRWHRDYLTKQVARRKAQQEHFNAIAAILAKEPPLAKLVETAHKARLDLARHSDQGDGEAANINVAPQMKADEIDRLRSFVGELRTALQRLKLMRQEEPEDACALQGQLEYESADDGKYYKGLENVRAAIEEKLQQHDQASAWILMWRQKATNPQEVVPPVLARQSASQLARHSKLGLITARKLLETVEGANGNDEYDGAWLDGPFEAARELGTALPIGPEWGANGGFTSKLTQAGVTARLQEEEFKKHVKAERSTPLYAITELPNQDRIKQIQTILEGIQESRNMRAQLTKYVGDFDVKWEQFQQAVANLYAAPRFRLRKLTDRSQWGAILKAKREFEDICPDYQEFRTTLRQLHQDLGVPDLSSSND